MDIMTPFIEMLVSYWHVLLELLDLFKFKFFGLTISFYEVLISFFLVFMVISIYWKGAKA